MEIVIKITDELFEAYKHWDKHKIATVEQSLIVHGTVLPKGHGQLKDADYIRKEIISHLGIKSEDYLLEAEKAVYKCIVEAPAIIEADKEAENDT